MSCSSCFNCQGYVRMYEKYCPSCALSFKQDDMYWKNCGCYTKIDVQAELYKDAIETTYSEKHLKRLEIKQCKTCNITARGLTDIDGGHLCITCINVMIKDKLGEGMVDFKTRPMVGKLTFRERNRYKGND